MYEKSVTSRLRDTLDAVHFKWKRLTDLFFEEKCVRGILTLILVNDVTCVVGLGMMR